MVIIVKLFKFRCYLDNSVGVEWGPERMWGVIGTHNIYRFRAVIYFIIYDEDSTVYHFSKLQVNFLVNTIAALNVVLYTESCLEAWNMDIVY